VGREGFSKVFPSKLDNQGPSLITKLTYFGATIPFQSSKRLGRVDRGQATKKLLENINPNMVDYIGLVKAITSRSTTTIHGIGRKLR